MEQSVDSTTISSPEIMTPLNPPPTKSTRPSRRLILGLTAIFTLILAGGTLFYFFNFKNTNANESSNKSSVIQAYSQKIENLAKSAVGINPSTSPAASAAPDPRPVSTSIDEIITSSGYTSKQVEYQDNSGPTLDKTNLKIKIPGQSRWFIRSVLAAEMQTLYPIYLQNPDIASLNTVANKLGIKAQATYPDSQQKYNVVYSDPSAELIYNPGAGLSPLSFESIPGSGDLPSTAEAQAIATTALQSIGVSLEGLKPGIIESSVASKYENFASTHKVLTVNYFRELDGHPVVLGDMNFFNNNPLGVSLSPIVSVFVTGGGKIGRIQVNNYGQQVGKEPVMMNSRTLNEATDELKTYGGHIRNITELEGQRSNFACAGNKCDVHDAVITKATLSYVWNNTLPAHAFAEIDNTAAHAFEYLMPVWIFEGTGNMDKSKTDQTGKLLPNPDKNNPAEYYVQPVKFVTTIPAVTQTNDVNLLSTRNYKLTRESDTTAKVIFDTSYHFPTFSTASLMSAEPRNGVKYKLLVLFPDKTYTVINGYKQEVYSGEITFPIGTQKGTITTYLELSDFSNLIEKRTLLVE